MNNTIERKLLHFYTAGNIEEDFNAARTRKISKFRRFIRLCFYIHLAVAAVCIVLAAALRTGAAVIASTAVCEIILVGTAFLSVGDMVAFKVLLFCGDGAFAAAMFITRALGNNEPALLAIAVLSVVTALTALAAFFAAYFRAYLESFPLGKLKREHFSKLPSFTPAADTMAPDIPELPDLPEEPIAVPPPKSEFKELSDKLKGILCSDERGTSK